jgi:outer membrane PBP1 activator LpoA protein
LSKQLLNRVPHRRAGRCTGQQAHRIEARDDFDYIFLASQATRQNNCARTALRITGYPIDLCDLGRLRTGIYNNDLDGLRFIDMPRSSIAIHRSALLTPWSPVGNSLRSRSRLYAFGIDAFNLVNWLKTPQPQLASPLRGVTACWHWIQRSRDVSATGRKSSMAGTGAAHLIGTTIR